MANKIYPKYKKALISGGANIDLLAGTVKAILVDKDAYVYSDAHEFLSSVPVGARTAVSGALTSKTVSNLAAFDSDDPVLPGVTGAQSEALIVFIDTGSEGTSRLVMYQDADITGAPITPNGSDIRVTVDAAGWFI